MSLNEKDLSDYLANFDGASKTPQKKAIYNREEILILLVAYESEYFDEYKTLFAKDGVRIIAVSSEKEFLNFSRIIPVNGIAVDFPPTKHSEEVNDLLDELEKNYPFLQIEYNPCINTIYNLEDFIEEKCQNFTARTIRSAKRIPISLNVEISPEKEFIRVEKSVTLDISESGLFVLATEQMWENTKKCFVSIKEFNSSSLIECDIVRQIRWGEKPFRNPGIGLKIESIHESLRDDFYMLLKKWQFD